MTGTSSLYTSKEAAAFLRVSSRTVAEMAKRGQLPSIKIGRSVRFDVRDLEAFVERCRKGVSP